MTTENNEFDFSLKSEEVLAKLAALASAEDYKICVEWREQQLKTEKPSLKTGYAWNRVNLDDYMKRFNLTDKVMEAIYTTEPDYVKAGEKTKVILYGDPHKTGESWLNYSHYEITVWREDGSSAAYYTSTGKAQTQPELHGTLNVEKMRSEIERGLKEARDIMSILVELKAAVQNEMILSWLKTETGWVCLDEGKKFFFGNAYTKKFYSSGEVFSYSIGYPKRKSISQKEAKEKAFIYSDFSPEEHKVKGMRISQLKEALKPVGLSLAVYAKEVAVVSEKGQRLITAVFERDRDVVFVDKRELLASLHRKTKETEKKHEDLVRENRKILDRVQDLLKQLEIHSNTAGVML